MRSMLALAAVLLAVSTLRAGPEPDMTGAPHVHTSRRGARALALPDAEDSFRFVIFGDRTGGPAVGIRVLEQAVRDVNLLDPDLVINVGDMVQGYNEREPWLAQMREFRGVMDGHRMRWFPVCGNHDVTWRGGETPPGHHESDYETHFGPLWYRFVHRNAAFVVLYSDEGDRARNRKGWGDPAVNRFGDEQLAWLRKTLAGTRDLDHVFVFLHHPRWIESFYPGSNWDTVHRLLVEAGNVTAVFAGHIHRRRYDGERDGIEYFCLATTGGAIPFSVPGTGFLHHMNVVTVRPTGIHVATLPVGRVLDPREMTPERWAEVDRVRGVRPRLLGDGFALRASGAADGVLRLEVRNATEIEIAVTLELETRDGAWWFSPDHVHLRLAPGETAEAAFRYRRDGGDGLAGLGVPALYASVDALGNTLRISLPPRSIPVPARLADLDPAALPAVAEGALRLRGGGDALRVPADALDLPDGPFTVEGWLRPERLEGRRALLAKTERSEYAIFVGDGRPAFLVHLNGAYVRVEDRETGLETGRWHHLAGVYDGAELRLYVNGRCVGTRQGTGARGRNRLPLLVGADPDRRGVATSGLTGRIDEVRVSTTVRYEGPSFTPSRRFEADADTALLLHCDRRIGPFVPDFGPSGRHATVVGKVRIVPVAER